MIVIFVIGVGSTVDAKGCVLDDLRCGGCDAHDGVEYVWWGCVGADGGDQGLDAG